MVPGLPQLTSYLPEILSRGPLYLVTLTSGLQPPFQSKPHGLSPGSFFHAGPSPAHALQTRPAGQYPTMGVPPAPSSARLLAGPSSQQSASQSRWPMCVCNQELTGSGRVSRNPVTIPSQHLHNL